MEAEKEDHEQQQALRFPQIRGNDSFAGSNVTGSVSDERRMKEGGGRDIGGASQFATDVVHRRGGATREPASTVAHGDGARWQSITTSSAPTPTPSELFSTSPPSLQEHERQEGYEAGLKVEGIHGAASSDGGDGSDGGSEKGTARRTHISTEQVSDTQRFLEHLLMSSRGGNGSDDGTGGGDGSDVKPADVCGDVSRHGAASSGFAARSVSGGDGGGGGRGGGRGDGGRDGEGQGGGDGDAYGEAGAPSSLLKCQMGPTGGELTWEVRQAFVGKVGEGVSYCAAWGRTKLWEGHWGGMGGMHGFGLGRVWLAWPTPHHTSPHLTTPS